MSIVRSIALGLAATAASLAMATSTPAQQLDARRAAAMAPGRLAEPEITLLIQMFGGGEFERWVRNFTESEPVDVRFRWSTTHEDLVSAEYQVLRNHDDTAPIKRGNVPVPAPGKVAFFNVDFRPIVGSATQRPLTYWVRVVGYRSGGGSSSGDGPVVGVPVRINIVEPPEPTQFTAHGLYPELWRPMPVYVNMGPFTIIKADEEDDEEPYIVPVVLYLDGTTIDVMRLNQSSVRIATARRHDTQGNIPQYNSSIGSGDAIAVPDDVGYFETTILPVSLELADKNLFGFEVDYTHLVGATTVWVLVLALEEDNTSLESANAVRDAFVAGLKAELENCLRSLTFPEVLALVKNGENVNAILTRDDGSACGYTASEEEGTVLDQIRAKLKDVAIEAGKAEELDEAKNWLPGGGLFLLHQIANPDDVVGFAYQSFTYEDLMNASGPIKTTFDFHTNLGPEFPRAGRKEIRYQLGIEIGRCEKVPNRPRCTPTHKPYLNQ